ncbi:MAG: peptidase M16 [Ponticaulis sp.]|nr:peptidase M16 [Ponticaulis sp.]|tara:strand:- start:11038 stop:12585 length:1548 start_codon:yes stop_codon:yes gene_type:complete
MTLKTLLLSLASVSVLAACSTSGEGLQAASAATPEAAEASSSPEKTGLSNIQVVESDDGYSAWLVTENAIPIVSVNMAWRGGETSDPDGLRGAADLMVYMMNEGAGDLDSQAFAQRMEELNMSFGCSTGSDWTSCSMSTLSENFEEAMDLVRMGLTETRFDEDPFNRAIEETLVRLQRAETDPGTIASRAMFDAIYPDHPYAHYSTPETVEAVTAEDAKARRDAIMTKDTLLLTVVGDISPERLKPVMEETFAGLPETSQAPVLEEVVLKSPPEDVVVKDLPQPQSLVMFVAPGLKRNDEDFFAAYVTNYILGGGGFSARLMDEIREKRGLTYGIYTSLSTQDHLGRWAGSAQTANENVGELIGRTKAEIHKLATEGPTEAELLDAKSYLTGAYPLGFDSNSKIASQMMGVRQEALGMDYFANRNAMVEAVTIDDVKRVAAEFLQPENFTFVVVGQPEGMDQIQSFYEDSLAGAAEEAEDAVGAEETDALDLPEDAPDEIVDPIEEEAAEPQPAD